MAALSLSKYRILLINPSITGAKRYGRYRDVGSYLPPYGLLCIAGRLEQDGHDVRIVDADAPWIRNPKGLLHDAVKAFSPDVIGLTAYSIGRENVISSAQFLRERHDGLIVVGGPHVISFPEDLAGCGAIDLLVYGEGETVFPEILEYFSGSRPKSAIGAVCYREEGKTILTECRPYIRDLDMLPYPAFHLLDRLHDYKPMQLLYKSHPVATLIMARGCPFNCIFCNSIWGKKVRSNSPDYIVGLMSKLINDAGIREFLFYEDTFCIDHRRVEDLCDKIINENLNVRWSCSANVRTITKPLLQKMKRAGCWLISIGIESGNNQVLKFIRKPVTTDEVRVVCAWADEIDIRIRGFFMIGHLIDTQETIRQTIDFAKELPLYTVNFCIMQVLPGSRAREIAHRYGRVNYDLTIGTGHPSESLSFVPRNLTADYLKKMQRRAYTEFFIRPIQMLRLLKEIESLQDVKKHFRLVVAFFKLFL